MMTNELKKGNLHLAIERHLKFIADTFMNNPNQHLDSATRSRLEEATLCMEENLNFLANIDYILDEVRLRLASN